MRMLGIVMLFSTGSGFAQSTELDKEKPEYKKEYKYKKDKEYRKGKEGYWKDKKGENEASNPEEKMKKLDTNSDGKLSREEVSKSDYKKLHYKFEYADKNEDGFIDLEELKAKMAKYKEKKNY